MKTDPRSPASLTDEQLIFEVKALTGLEREATARLIASLAELDARRLYLGEGFRSLFTYCTQCLYLSEHAAYGRIEAARAARQWPIILELLSDGSITLTTVCLLAPHLTAINHRDVLEAAKHKSKREVESQVAALRPLPDVPSSVRKLPVTRPTASPARTPVPPSTPTPADVAGLRMSPAAVGNECSPQVVESRPSAAISRPAVVAPLSPERYKVQVTISRDTHDKLRRVQDLLRHAIPDGDPAVIFDRAISLLLVDLERKKLAQTNRPRPISKPQPGSRHVPAAVRREVWKRDGGQCAFVGSSGQCTERGCLEFHHVVPFADGGPTTSDNLQLRCRAHNGYEAEEHFGSMLFRESGPIYGLGPDRVPPAER